MLGVHGIDLDDLDSQHRLTSDPTVRRLRQAAELLGDDVWIAVKLPGAYDDLDDDAAVCRWITVAIHPDELGWLREALALNAADEPDEDGELDPLSTSGLRPPAAAGSGRRGRLGGFYAAYRC